MRNNPKIYLPKARPYKEEAILESKEQVYKDTWSHYQTKFCNSKGDQHYSNLTQAQERGKVKLLKRIELGEIIISETDKSQSFTASTPENYMAQGDKHTLKDKQISWKEYKEITNEMMQRVNKHFPHSYGVGGQ